ncbi:MAG: HNH endonuclease [Nitrosopumilus sp.]
MKSIDDVGCKADRLSASEWNERRKLVLVRDDYACVKCGHPADEVDHIVPKCIGGGDDLSNLQSLCHDCHRKKTRKDIRYNKGVKHYRAMKKWY